MQNEIPAQRIILSYQHRASNLTTCQNETLKCKYNSVINLNWGDVYLKRWLILFAILSSQRKFLRKYVNVIHMEKKISVDTV